MAKKRTWTPWLGKRGRVTTPVSSMAALETCLGPWASEVGVESVLVVVVVVVGGVALVLLLLFLAVFFLLLPLLFLLFFLFLSL